MRPKQIDENRDCPNARPIQPIHAFSWRVCLRVGCGCALPAYALPRRDGWLGAAHFDRRSVRARRAWHALETRTSADQRSGDAVLPAVTLYRGHLARAEQVFLLKYALSSQSAILWMSALFAFSTIFYWIGVCARAPLGFNLGMRLCWSAVLMGATGMMARWYESYLIGADVGHIPISNLYEVFILFCLITALFYLYYEAHYQTHALGAFALLLISA